MRILLILFQIHQARERMQDPVSLHHGEQSLPRAQKLLTVFIIIDMRTSEPQKLSVRPILRVLYDRSATSEEDLVMVSLLKMRK